MNPLLKNIKNKSNQPSNLRNIALRVEKYADKFSIIGTDLETGKLIRVSLTTAKQTSGYKRPEIMDFMKAESNIFVNKGGVILFDKAKQTSDSVFEANWATRLSSDPKQALVFVGMASLKSGESKNGRGYMFANFAKTKTASTVSNNSEFKDTVIKMMEPVNGVANNIVCNLSDDTTTVSTYMNASKHETGVGYNEFKSGEESYNDFINQNENSESIMSAVNSDDINVELIELATLWAGPATLEKHLNDENKESLENMYKLSDDSCGFVKSIVTVRSRADGTFYLTGIKPISNNVAAVESSTLSIGA